MMKGWTLVWFLLGWIAVVTFLLLVEWLSHVR
jgi:hypothetical protein